MKAGLWNAAFLNPTHASAYMRCGEFMTFIGLTGNESNKLGKFKLPRLEWFDSWRRGMPLIQVDMERSLITREGMETIKGFDTVSIGEPWFLSCAQIAEAVPTTVFTYENLAYVHNTTIEQATILKCAQACRLWIVATEMAAFAWGSVMGDASFKKKVRVVKRAIDVDFFKPDENKPKNEKVRILLNGRKTWSKGYEDLLFAAKALSRVRDDFEICFIGKDDGAEEHLTGLVERLELKDRVTLLPQRDYHLMPTLYNEVDVLCVLSIPVQGWHEQYCLSILEGMASGLPVIVTESDGSMAQLRHDDFGMIPVNRHDILADRLRQLLDSEQLRRETGAEMRRRAEVYFNAETRAQELKALYGGCL